MTTLTQAVNQIGDIMDLQTVTNKQSRQHSRETDLIYCQTSRIICVAMFVFRFRFLLVMLIW